MEKPLIIYKMNLENIWMRFMISMDTRMKIIAHIHTDFPDKFGIPRQSGLVEGLTGEITFEPEYRNPEITGNRAVQSYLAAVEILGVKKRITGLPRSNRRGLEVKYVWVYLPPDLLSDLMISGFPACVCFVWNRRRKDRSFMWREQI